ncbi:translation initiation factor IF-2 [Marinilabiliaceae bacterium ANBcel2]|nr:translation initiation factor IF-2 [Marinilabiliaceae bacterium ANBcel2]
MAVGQRLSKVAKNLNVGTSTIVDFLRKKGFDIEMNPNFKVSKEMMGLLEDAFRQDQSVKKASEELIEKKQKEKEQKRSENISIEENEEESAGNSEEEAKKEDVETEEPSSARNVNLKVVGKIDLDKKKSEDDKPKKEAPQSEEKSKDKSKEDKKRDPDETTRIKVEKEEPKVVGKIDLDKKKSGDKPKKEDESTKVEAKKIKSEKEVSKKPSEKERSKKPAEIKKEQPSAHEKGKKDASKKGEVKKDKPSKDGQVKDAPRKVEKEKPVSKKSEPKEKEKVEKAEGDKDNFRPTQVKKLSGPTVVGKIDLPANAQKNGNESREDKKSKRRKRKRIRKEKERVNINAAGAKAAQSKDAPHRGAKEKEGEKKRPPRRKQPPRVKKRPARPEVNEEDVAKQIKETLARLTTKGKSKSSRYRKDKRDQVVQKQKQEADKQAEEKKVLHVTEFVTANELASLMDVSVNEIIASCMSLGMFVSINQRLDAETISLVSEEFGYKVEFISVDVAESIDEGEDRPEDLKDRPPIVTVMGHVDHGKTSLLDYIRKADVTAGEAGGITQHIGAYGVKLEGGRQITFLDTPGHEAFTAMRARGAQVTDIAIIIIAANDNVMPQTVEAINHASAAGVPIVFAISKIDVPGANPDKVKESLANMNYLVEDWGGKYQCQEVSAKHGTNVKDLLEKVVLESELLELKANPEKPAVGSVIESTLDRGRGYVATLLVQAGQLKVGDLILAGSFYGHVKAMFNERNQQITAAGPSEPVLILGLNGAPQAGEKFNVMDSEKETKDIATKRQQLQREQGMRAQKHITLDEIGRRIAIGNFQELNIIVKGDVDGSIEALADALIKLSTEEIQVNVIHKAVGGISESDVMLAAASNAILVGFQVRPSMAARKLAEKEQIDIRIYSIIYDAIEEITAAMEGMLSPEIKEQIVSTVEVLDVFKISKVGKVAGCIVREGKIKRSSKIRVIRDGIVIYTGELGSLKRFKDDAKEVASGFECGLNVANFNDIKVGDIVEAYEEFEVSRKL